MNPSAGIPTLIIADDRSVQEQASSILGAHGIGPVTALADGRRASSYLEEHPCDLVVLDVGGSLGEGTHLIGDIAALHPRTAIIAVSPVDQAMAAMACIHHGACDYLITPLEPERMASAARRALSRQRVRPAPAVLAPDQTDDPFAEIITTDGRMAEIFAYAQTIAGSGQPILITGETGTGKDLLARAVHRLSGCLGDYVAINLAGLDDTMFSDNLFGHRRGAFTGATEVRAGLVLRASSGTLFLDEIGDLSPASQVKLLRLLQDGEYYPLGCDQPKYSTARVIAATSADLPHLVASGRLRKDLYYRLQTHQIELPPLRERCEDLPLLMRHFAARAAADLSRPLPEIDTAAIAFATQHLFPGNVRELQSLMYDAVCRTPAGAPLEPDMLRRALRRALEQMGTLPAGMQFPEMLPFLADMNELLVAEALRRTGGNQAQAAALLGVSRQAINKRRRARG